MYYLFLYCLYGDGHCGIVVGEFTLCFLVNLPFDVKLYKKLLYSLGNEMPFN